MSRRHSLGRRRQSLNNDDPGDRLKHAAKHAAKRALAKGLKDALARAVRSGELGAGEANMLHGLSTGDAMAAHRAMVTHASRGMSLGRHGGMVTHALHGDRTALAQNAIRSAATGQPQTGGAGGASAPGSVEEAGPRLQPFPQWMHNYMNELRAINASPTTPSFGGGTRYTPAESEVPQHRRAHSETTPGDEEYVPESHEATEQRYQQWQQEEQARRDLQEQQQQPQEQEQEETPSAPSAPSAPAEEPTHPFLNLEPEPGPAKPVETRPAAADEDEEQPQQYMPQQQPNVEDGKSASGLDALDDVAQAFRGGGGAAGEAAEGAEAAEAAEGLGALGEIGEGAEALWAVFLGLL